MSKRNPATHISRRQLLRQTLGLAVLPAWVRQVSPQADTGTDPFVVVLGTAQDAGVPQVNCFDSYCARVRQGLAPKPRVACLGLVDPVAKKRFVIDATPDFVAQVEELLAMAAGDGPASEPPASHATAASTPGSGQHRPLRLTEHLHGVLLTHSHMGHYTGLIHIGREGAGTREMPVYTSRRMASYLRSNQPWQALVELNHVRLVEIAPGQAIELTEHLTVTPVAVVHRAEFADTVGFLVAGPRRRLLYVPDADRWDDWPVPFETWLDAADVALLDGSFFSADELGHRRQSEVPHPPVSVTMERLGHREGRPDVAFIHLNHTNPLWDPGGPERAAVAAAGFSMAERGQRFPL